MRGKTAKKLRRQAEAETVGLPAVNYAQVAHTVTKGGATTKSTQIVLGNCTRKRYKELKDGKI